MSRPAADRSPLDAAPDARPVVALRGHPSPHPFLKPHLLASEPRDLHPGTLVRLALPDGGFLGDGFFNGRSEIRVRRLTRDGLPFDRAALGAALDRAAALREALPGVVAAGDAWRVVHAEADGLSGLVVDRYGDVLSVELHSAGWMALLDPLLELLHARLGTSHHHVTLSERVAAQEGVRPLRRSSEGAPERVVVHEHEVRYRVDFAAGHKTGFFCDQRDNRLSFAALAAGDVLDACCYTGGFSLNALQHGDVRSVTAVDLDEQAVEAARGHAKLNQHGSRLKLVHADVFDWMRQVHGTERRFDSIVLDPPKFIPERGALEKGEAKYHDLNRLALKLLRPGGLLLTCSCSGLLPATRLIELVRTAARKEGRDAALLAVTGAAPDHPVGLECPETEYLAALWLRVW